jgi:CheY-like chemotaxis protein
MVQQILAFARGSGGEKTVLHVNLLLREMGKIITDTFPKSIVCRIKAGPDAWPVLGQAIQLHQVIMNLCINARDAMPKGGTLVLATENVVVSATQAAPYGVTPGSYLCLSVRDTGTGILEAQLPQIFQPFFTTKAPGHGTGLGLSTCQMIVKNHGGFLTVESTVGRGTDFKAFFPAGAGAIEDAKLSPGVPAPIGKGEHILVVDDEAAILALAQSTLETYGYRVHTAASGPEAIVIFGRQHQNIRVVIMDRSMPFMDGAATVSALRKIKPDLKLISASGHDLHKVTDTQRAIKADAFIDKPFTIERLLFAISEVLAKG